MLGAGLKDNPYLDFAVVTGIYRVAKESIFSGLNNIEVNTILDNEYLHFGITEEELEQILNYYDIGTKINEVQSWYNGYNFKGTKVYNPWSILHFVKKKELKPYWVNTSDNLMIKNLLVYNEDELYDDLQKLYAGESLEVQINDYLTFDNFNHPISIWSFLMFSGYLTYDSPA